MRIKKKDAVIAFQETLAFHVILLGVSVVVFFAGVYSLTVYFWTNTTLALASGLLTAGAAFAIFYNLNHMRDAKVPKQTMNRMKRR